MSTINLWPNPGLTVHAEDGSVIPGTGIAVSAPLSDFYRNLQAVGWLTATQPVGTPTAPTLLSARVINVRALGATGVNDQALYPVTPYAPVNPAYFVTQQTTDAIAINAAIDSLRAQGGGSLYLPAGTYTHDRSLSVLDFPVKIYGDGPGKTVLKSTNSASNTVHSGQFFIDTRATSICDISIENLTLDGNGDVRAAPAEGLSMLIACYGPVRLSLRNVVAKNSTMDCLFTNYGNDEVSSLRASDCVFSRSRRNTVSIISGCKQQYTNCIFEGGGRIYAPISPQSSMDIEPDTVSPTNVLKDILFTNCVWRDSLGITLVASRANATFVNCVVERNNTDGTLPWILSVNWGQYKFTGCKFTDKTDYNSVMVCGEEEVRSDGSFRYSQYAVFDACTIEGCGFQSGTPHTELSSCTFRNSARPVLVNYSSSTAGSSLSTSIKDVELINVVDVQNITGQYSAFCVATSTLANSYVDIAGLSIRFVPTQLPPDADALLGSGVTTAFGVYISSSSTTIRAAGVHVAGYYQKYPAHYGKTLGALFADWALPSSAPVDTAGQTTTPGSAWYRNCSMYGNSP